MISLNEQESLERQTRLGKAVWKARASHTRLQPGTSHDDIQAWANRPWESLPPEERDEYIAIADGLWNAVFKELDDSGLAERHELLSKDEARSFLLELTLKDPLKSAIYTKTDDKIISGVVDKLYSDSHTAIAYDVRIEAVASLERLVEFGTKTRAKSHAEARKAVDKMMPVLPKDLKGSENVLASALETIVDVSAEAVDKAKEASS